MAESFQQLGFGLGFGILIAALGYSFFSAQGTMGRFVNQRTTLLIWTITISCAVFWWAVGALHHYAFKTILWDEGLFINILSNTLHGHFLETKIYNGSYLYNHFSPSLALLALVYAPWQHPIWLSGIRALMATSGAVGLYFLIKELGLPKTAGLLFSLVWLGNIGLRGAMFSDFHEVTIVSGLMIWVAYLVLKKQLLWAMLLAFILMGFKEDVPIYIGGLGIIIALSYKRKIAGWLIVMLAAVYYLSLQLFVWSWISLAHLDYISRKMPFFQHDNMTLLQVILNDPLVLIRHLLYWDRLYGIILLFMPVLFLPFLRFGWLGLILPLWLLLSVDNYNVLVFSGYYVTSITTLIILAAIPGYQRFVEKKPDKARLLRTGMAGLTLGAFISINPEIAYAQFNIYNYLPHPEVAIVDHIESITPKDESVNTDFYVGTHFANINKLRIFPELENWLADRLYLSNKALGHPLTILSIAELGYKSIHNTASFLFLSRQEGTDARELFMQRLRLMEAEGASLTRWSVMTDNRASNGRAMLIPSIGNRGDRSLLTPRLLLPPGEYCYVLKVAAKTDALNPPCLILEARFLSNDFNDKILTSKVFSSNIWLKKASYQQLRVPFKVDEWGLVYLNANFGKAQDIRLDFIALEGLPKTFDEYFHSIFPITLIPCQACQDPRLIKLDDSSISGQIVLVGSEDGDKTICRWHIDANLPEGDYWLYYISDSYDRLPLSLNWADLVLVQPGNSPDGRTVLTPLIVNRTNSEDEQRIEHSATTLHLKPNFSLELITNHDIPVRIGLDRLWLCRPVIIDPTVTVQ